MSKDISTISTVLEGILAEKASAGPAWAPDIKRMLWLRAPLMLVVALVLAIPAVIAAWFLTPAVYTASAEIRFLAAMPRVMSDDRAGRESSAPYEKFLNTQISLITGNTILTRVLDDPAIRDLPSLKNEVDPLEFLKRRVDVRNQRSSELVMVTCTLENKDDARQILSSVIKIYMDYALGAEASAGGERLSILTKERDARQVELEARLRQITELQSSLGIAIVGEKTIESTEGDIYRKSLVEAEDGLSKAKTQVADIQMQLDQLKGLQEQYRKNPDKEIFESNIEERVSADPRVSALRQDLARAEATLAQAVERQVEGSPLRKESERRVATIKTSLSQVEHSARSSVLESSLAQFEQKLDTAAKSAQEGEERVTNLRQQLGDYSQRMDKAADRFAELEELKRKASETRSMLENVRREITDINLESKAAARVQLASQASVPAGGPNHTQRYLVIAMAIALSIGAGIGAGVLRELTDQQVRGAQDIQRVTRIPVVATLLEASDDKTLGPGDFALITADYPASTSAEECRRILARVLYPEDCSVEVKTIVISSPSEGDGKSSVACNLAVALADSSRRVLLVDLNARRPSLEHFLKLEPADGLAELLRGDANPEETIRTIAIEGVHVLGPGIDAEEIPGRLASREMVRFMEWAEEGFDHIILDTAPALLMSDVKLLAPIVDGVIVVVGAGVSNLGMIRRCLRELELTGANLMGIVLNRIHSTRGGYLRENQQRYQRYAKNSGNGKVQRDVADIKIVDDEEQAVVLLPYDHDTAKGE